MMLYMGSVYYESLTILRSTVTNGNSTLQTADDHREEKRTPSKKTRLSSFQAKEIEHDIMLTV